MRVLGLFFSLVLICPGAVDLEVNAPSAPKWIRGIYTARSPAPVTLPAAVARDSAVQIARAHASGQVLQGRGDSMAPLYQAGTLMVIHPVAFEQLERGQTVVYRNRQQQAVAHVLVARCHDGWRVAGLNNARPDADGVRADNLLGLVVAAIQPVADQRVAAR
jgi:hypothetical protein